MKATLLVLALNIIEAAIMSIDFGSEWMKIGLVKPGIPFDVVLNRDSKRKTQTIITIRGDERTYSTNGQNLGVRFPKDTYQHLKLLVSQLYNGPNHKLFMSFNTNIISKHPDRDTVVFESSESNKYTVEELLAMLFRYAQQEAEATAKEKVPYYFDQYERQSIIDAAKIANLNLLSLINDGSSVALNYAMTKVFENPETHVFYDMGSGNTICTIVRYKPINTTNVGKKTSPYVDVEILGVGFDKTLGGMMFDNVLSDFVINKFEETNKDLQFKIKDTPRTIRKLAKQVVSAKHILSANTETTISIESFHEDIDFRAKITRKEFESLSLGLFDRVSKPLEDALKAASITKVDSLVIVGGGVRIPRIQSNLVNYFGRYQQSILIFCRTLAQNINGDEAAVIGAVFYGASLSSQFKTRDLRLREKILFGVGGDKKSVKSIDVYESNSRVLPYKYLYLDIREDFTFELLYQDDHLSKLYPLIKIEISGMNDILSKYKDQDTNPKLKLALSFTPFGTFNVTSVKVVLQLPADKSKKSKGIFDYLLSFLKGSKDSKSTESASTDKSYTQSSDNPKATDIPEKKADKLVTKEFDLVVNYIDTGYALSDNELKTSTKLLNDFDNKDNERVLRDVSVNKLENYLYNIDSFVIKKPFSEFSTPEIVQELKKKTKEVSVWFEEFHYTASKKELDEKLDDIAMIHISVDKLILEHKAREKEIKSLNGDIKEAEKYLESFKNTTSAENLVTLESDINTFIKTLTSIKEWTNEKVSEQEKIPKTQEGVLKVKDIKEKQKEILEARVKLIQKLIAIPPPPKPSEPQTQGPEPKPTSSGDNKPDPSATVVPDSDAQNSESPKPDDVKENMKEDVVDNEDKQEL